MTDSVKVLAQVSPAAATLTTGYTAPSAATMSSIVICNTNASVTYFRISVAPSGASDNLAQYLYYDLPLDANDTFIATIGLTLAATDIVRVYAANNNVAFTFFGIEII